ncbi:hypothetical protein BSKO_02286 [Bryopsis sp. KO-2023]|nr:hypothetical protein BSKO_02286 [Bryopsis sp. KO-2023]
MAAESKKQCLRIGTHSGAFHCDEALGCWLLRNTDRFKDAQVVRSRDPEVLKDLNAVIDVGGVYDSDAYRFDHHQKEFSEIFGHGFFTKLSSAGLVYKHFGREVISRLLGIPMDDPSLDTIYLAAYKQFMEAIDAVDNGVNQWNSDAPPKYICNTSLSSRVSFLNPQWNEDSSDEVQYARFCQAMELTGSEFKDSIDYIYKGWLPARKFVKEALEQRFDVDSSGSIMRLNNYCPWKSHLYELENEMELEKPILFCLYEDGREKKWRVQSVSVSPGSFQSRKLLPTPWRGLRSGELDKASGIKGCVFIHSSGFIGGNDTYEGALEMARGGLTLE